MDSQKHGRLGRQRCLALLLVLALLCTNLVRAEDTDLDGTSSYDQVTTAMLMDSGGAYKTLTIESYLSNQGSESKEVKACDIIFVLDQSKWMNGTQGAERQAILNAMDQILEELEQPTIGGEHRVAIAGYGRVNVNQQYDGYNSTEYPGVQHKGNGISLNTGYYTAAGFQSKSGWTEVKDSSSAELPTMPSAYQEAMTYDSAFMSVSEAEDITDSDTMMAWYSGASRMDAGLTMAERLAQLANDEDPNDERNLIVCVVASSIPIQNYNSWNCIRDKAVTAAADNLKSLGATIFALGDYHNAGKNLAADTEAHFNEVMTSVCGNSDTPEAEKSDYFFSMSKYGSVTEALNRMITQVTVTVANSTMQSAEVSVDSVEDWRSNAENDWKSWLQEIYSNAPDTEVNIAYYAFTGWEYGEPAFSWEAYDQESTSLKELLQEDGTLKYTTKLIPIQDTDSVASGSPALGNKVVITISNPVTIIHQWASDAADYAPADVTLPADAHVALGGGYMPTTMQTTDSHYQFDGWYIDEECTNPVVGLITPGKRGLILYGKWTRYALVNFYAQATSLEDENTWVKIGENLNDRTLDRTGYAFSGWYTDQNGTTAYVFTQPVTADLDLYAQWTANTYQVHFDANAEDATGTMEDQRFTYDMTQDLTENAFQREGCTFVGWNTQPDGTGTAYANGQSVRNLTPEPDGTITLYAQWTINTYQIAVSVTDGTSDPDVSTITVAHGESQTIVFTPNAGYTLESVTVDGEEADLDDNGAYTFHSVTADHRIHVVYSEDENQDGIPDKYQVFVEFQSADTAKGTVLGDGIKQVFTLADGEAQGTITPDMDTVTVSPADGYALDIWTQDGSGDPVNPAVTLENIPGGTTITFTARFATDTNGNGVPDKYQAVVTYEIHNGTWADGTSQNKTAIFDLKIQEETGAWVDICPTLGDLVPTGMQPDEKHDQDQGCWNEEITAETPVTGNQTYVYTYEQINQYIINVTVIDGTSSVGTAAAVEYGENQTITFQPDSGFVVDSVTVDGEAADLDDNGAYTFHSVTANHSIRVVYSEDENQDGIPDQYQVFVAFQSADTAKGTVFGDGIRQVFTLADGAAQGTITPDMETVTVSPADGYALDIWTQDGGSDPVEPTTILYNIPGGTTITFTAHFDRDANGDTTPDKYQAVVTYQIVNGTWDGESASDRTVYFALKTKQDGVWVEASPLLGDSVPTGMKANVGYTQHEGAWNEEISMETPVTENRTYVYTYGKINSYTITVEVVNGTSDPDLTEITVDHGRDQTITFTANSGYVLDSVTTDDPAVSLNNDGSCTFENVTEDHSITVTYAVDANKDGVRDKYQVFVRFQSADESRGTVTGSGREQVYTLLNKNWEYVTVGNVTPTLNGVTVTAQEGYAQSGWTRDGAVTDPTGTLENVSGGTTITFYAQWTAIAAAVTPKAAAYRVEHYQEQLDGTYILTDTEFPLYGDIGETVAATEKIYEHYHVSQEKSTASGTVIAPTVDESGEVSLLTLQVYYDLDTATVSYDLNGGTGAENTDYSTETVKYGTAQTLKAEPTRLYYAFAGWDVNGESYQPGDTVEIQGDTEVTAQWTIELVPDTGIETDMLPWAAFLLLGCAGLVGMCAGKIWKRRRGNMGK